MKTLARRDVLKGGALLAGTAVMGRLGFPMPAIAQQTTTLALYSGQHAPPTDAIADAFSEATGIEVIIRRGSSAQLANQIMEEGGRSPADIFYSEESPPAVALAEKGLLATIAPDTLKQVPAAYVAKDGTWLAPTARARAVAFNKAMIKESELPASVLDFAVEDWNGKFAYAPTSGAFQAQIAAISIMKGRDTALAWLRGLKDFGVSYNSDSGAMLAVEKGEIPVALVNNYYWYSVAREKGEDKMKSALHFIGHKDPGALIMVAAACLLTSSKKQDAGQQFLAFMVSEEGQKAIADAMAEYPLRPGMVSPYRLKPFDQLNPPPVTPSDIGDAEDALKLAREAGLA